MCCICLKLSTINCFQQLKKEEEEEATGECSTDVVGFLFFIVFLRDSQKVSKLLFKPSVANPKDANPKLAPMHCIMYPQQILYCQAHWRDSVNAWWTKSDLGKGVQGGGHVIASYQRLKISKEVPKISREKPSKDLADVVPADIVESNLRWGNFNDRHLTTY